MSIKEINAVRIYEGTLVKIGENIEEVKEDIRQSKSPLVVVKKSKDTYDILHISIGQFKENILVTLICQDNKIGKIDIRSYMRDVDIVDGAHVCANMTIPITTVENENDDVARHVIANRLGISKESVDVRKSGEVVSFNIREHNIGLLFKKGNGYYELSVVSKQ